MRGTNDGTEPVDTVDVVVVGAGSAGCAVARRLVERGRRVLLLEAGGPDVNPAIHDPLRFGELWFTEENWGYQTQPQRAADGRRLPWPRGRVLGGSSSLNAMIYARGAPADYDHWAYLGNTGWSWRDVLPVYRRMEDYDTGPTPLRGVGGPVPVLTAYRPDPIHESLVDAAGEVDVPFNPDYNSGDLDGISYLQFTVRDGRRCGSAAAYLRPVADRPELTVRTRARARRLLVDGDRCAGVVWERNGRPTTTRAEEEVVLAAGTLESPRLLMLSGIGDADELRGLGLDVVAHLPGVGRNLQDHLLVPVVFGTGRPLGRPSAGLPPAQTHLYWRSRPGLPVPDTQPLHFPVPMCPPGFAAPDSGFTLQAGLVRPASRGRLRLGGPEPDDELLIEAGVLRCAVDLDALVASVGLCRELGAGKALRQGWEAREVHPGPEVTGDEQVRAYVRATVSTYHHQVGTARMGVDEDAVVDPRLRVRGLRGLRVADASVMPTVPTGNTHAPAVMIGERAADFITGEQP
ncbi:FAD-dependent oxidoreductase [Micromonospora sp. WMMA1363]|uniref:GMC family oxidoreductase n=1 Tax=Micromonospora sp. WMMA1363 TaxID=3053985 RepID=UPI00259CB10C|nr:FAD-dependent oxidoreductase [Micromonospora sp. WMMA1363]MDM4722822.1 FAD-dependent oxidoreductase [Micromonospora sp. WMMA1363]